MNDALINTKGSEKEHLKQLHVLLNDDVDFGLNWKNTR